MQTIMPTCYAVAIVLRDGHRPGQFLTVQRPYDDDLLPGIWGLPAIMADADESPEDTARRVCEQKLGCKGEPIRFLGAMHQEREDCNLLLMDVEMLLQSGTQPDVACGTNGTKYIAQKWSHRPKDVLAAAQAGSCCSSIFLNDQGLMDRNQWRLSLVSA